MSYDNRSLYKPDLYNIIARADIQNRLETYNVEKINISNHNISKQGTEEEVTHCTVLSDLTWSLRPPGTLTILLPHLSGILKAMVRRIPVSSSLFLRIFRDWPLAMSPAYVW